MLGRIREAIEVANRPTSDANAKKEAFKYLEDIKSDPEATKIFVFLLTDPKSDDLAKFVALQSLGDLVLLALSTHNTAQLAYIKDSILNLLRDNVRNNARTPEFFRNKVVEVIIKLFCSLYGDVNGDQWSTFFQDIVNLLMLEPLTTFPSTGFSFLGLEYFVRICGYINSEIADQTFVRSRDIQLRNNSLKDAMRTRDIQLIVTIWFNTLRNLVPQQPQQQPSFNAIPTDYLDIINSTLACIGSYISWIDVNLIINEEYITLIYNYLDFPQTQVACSQCLCEIISKKMKPSEKLQLMSMLNLTDKIAAIDQDDTDINEALAKLSASSGLELSIILEQCYETPVQDPAFDEMQQIAASADRQILERVAPLVLKYMANEYDSVTQQCFPFISQYLAVMKKQYAIGGKPGSAVAVSSKRLPLDQEHTKFLVSLLNIIFAKMRIDDSSDEDSDEEIEEFTETIRNKLKVFQDSIAVINPSVYLENISNQIESLFVLANTSKNWRDMELTIYQIYNLAESIRNNLFGLNKQDIASSQPSMVVAKFMKILLENSAVFVFDNLYIQISFFELVVRHNNYLNNEKDEFQILDTFCSEFGIFNRREKVRLRTWYLFTRLLKVTKPKLSTAVVNEIIGKISPLLTIRVTTANGEESNEEDTTFSTQLYLYEGVGLLIGLNSDLNYDLMDNILGPSFTDLEGCISSQTQTPAIVLQCHHILMAVGTLARGVHSGLVPENSVNNALVSKKLINQTLIEKFSNIAEVVLVTFSYFNNYENIRDASRFTFSRLIPILGSRIVPFANKLIGLFLVSDLKVLELCDFLGFLGQMVHMFCSDDSSYEAFNNILTPVIEKIHSVLNLIDQESNNVEANFSNGTSLENGGKQETQKDGVAKSIVLTDSFRDKITLKKAYYAFLQSFITNSVTSILLTPNNSNTLSIILSDLLSYTPEEVQEASTIKLALNVLVNFIKQFGSGVCNDPKDTHASSISKIEGLNEYFITQTIPLVFEIPFRPEYKFDIRVGNYRVVACDLSRILKELCIQSGNGTDDINSNACVKYLSEVYLPQIQFPPQLIGELIQMLVQLDRKAFEKYYVALVERLTS